MSAKQVVENIDDEKDSAISSRSEYIPVQTHPYRAVLILVGGIALLAFALALSISVGAAYIPLSGVWNSVFHFNPHLTNDQIVHYLRLPRALAAMTVGVCFAVAGAIMQGMTRNPLADPGLLGINAGSELVLAVCFAFMPKLPFLDLMLISFVGAGLGAGVVYGIGSLAKGGLTPIRLTLAGAVVGMLLSALSQGIAIYFNLSQDLAFWYAGGLSGTTWKQVAILCPFAALGLIGALLMSRSVTVLSLGDDVATGLGQRTRVTKLLCTLVVLVLAGSAVSVVGPIAFVGLIIPHVARFLVGVDYRLIIPCSAVLGGLLMVFADIGGRMVNPPYETPVGTITALIGVPFFLYLSRRSGRAM